MVQLEWKAGIINFMSLCGLDISLKIVTTIRLIHLHKEGNNKENKSNHHKVVTSGIKKSIRKQQCET